MMGRSKKWGFYERANGRIKGSCITFSGVSIQRACSVEACSGDSLLGSYLKSSPEDPNPILGCAMQNPICRA